VTTIFFFATVLATQYKQRGNFDLFCTDIFKKGFTRGTWNYFEASHGKGAPDGVGGTLKRRVDRLVSQGVHIPTALSLYQALSEGQSKVEWFHIQEQAVEDAVKEMPDEALTRGHSFTWESSLPQRQLHLFCNRESGV
jgi:hypothetical protein